MIKYRNNIEIALYADDTAFYLAADNIPFLNKELNTAAENFKYWCDINKLTLNLQKSKVLMISGLTAKKTKQLKQQVDIQICTSLQLIKEYKYLVVLIDERLSFYNHVDMVKKKISLRLYLLRKIRWVIGFRDALLLYKSRILPFFDLGIIFYSCDATKINSLQILKNRALRTIIGKKIWSNTDDAHKNCNLLEIKARQRLFLVKHIHKRSFYPVNMIRHPIRTLRSARKSMLHDDRPKTSKFEYSYSYKGIKIWNWLPEDIKRIRDLDKFKTRVNKELMQGKLNFPE